MKNAGNTSGASIVNDYDEVTRQLAALRDDMSNLADSVTGLASRRGKGLASDIAEGFGEAKSFAGRTGKSAEAQLENSVAAHPWLAIAVAAGAGLLLGALSRR